MTTGPNLAEHERKVSAEYGEPAKPVTVDAGADETQAMPDGDSFEVVTRIGAVVAHLRASDTELGNVEYAVKVQIARLRSGSNSTNPNRCPPRGLRNGPLPAPEVSAGALFQPQESGPWLNFSGAESKLGVRGRNMPGPAGHRPA
ncbi:hypothetical protein AB0B13_18985 [Streptomyces sp. NPDC042898]|uniref:hypothetical protein n=1 Tax=Streptomyces sp. NPDC042898 TaxID=3154334 RepID=UPI0033E95D0E